MLYTLTVTSKDSASSNVIKDILKSKINPTEIKVGMNSLKSLKNGRVQIETSSKEEIEILTKDINEKCGGELVANVHTLRNPNLIIYNVPEDISTLNISES